VKARLLVLGALLTVGVVLLGGGYYLSLDRTPERPNVVFLLLDTLRYDRIGAEHGGEPVAPFLTALAEEARFYTHAYSPSSWTKPAMASMFTSRYVDAHGVYYSARFETPDKPTSDLLAASFETLAEYLGRFGYATRGVQTNANLAPAFGFAQGFHADHYPFENGWSAEWVVDQALAGVASAEPPFYLYAHFMDPHAVYDPPAEYREVFGPLPELTETDRELIDPDRFMAYYFDQVHVALGLKEDYELPQLSENGRRTVELLYDAEVRYLDDQVRRLVTALREQAPDTVFVIAADHGEEFWERGGLGHGTTMYQELVHVPLWVFGPGITPGRDDTPVNLVGLMPTIAEALGLPPREGWQGRSWLSPAGGHIFSDSRGSYPEERVNTEALVREGYKLIIDHGHGWTQLYDLAADPLEQRDLAGAMPERVAEMSAALAAHRAANLELRGEAPAHETSSALDAELVERLRALGYGGDPLDGEARAEEPQGRPRSVPEDE